MSGVTPLTVWRKVIRGEDPGRYQLLCFNCNLKKSILRNRIGAPSGRDKRCSTCSTSKDLSYFKSDRKYPDGLYYECRPCTRSRILALKVDAITRVGSGSCLCEYCKSGDLWSLTFDHVDDDGDSTRDSDGLGESLYRRIVRGKIDTSRFQVLCLNCNLKKHKDRSGAKLATAGFKALSPQPAARLPSPSEASELDPTLVEFQFSDVVPSVDDSPKASVVFLQKHHYAGYGRAGSVHVVFHVGGELAAVAKFASAIRQEVATSAGLDYGRTLELDRFCVGPAFRKKNLPSFLLSSAVRCVQKVRPDVAGFVSFADPAQGHSGAIYKAANWKEVVGRIRSDYQYVGLDGKIVHKKTVFDQAKARLVSETVYAADLRLQKVSIPAKKKFVLMVRGSSS